MQLVSGCDQVLVAQCEPQVLSALNLADRYQNGKTCIIENLESTIEALKP